MNACKKFGEHEKCVRATLVFLGHVILFSLKCTFVVSEIYRTSSGLKGKKTNQTSLKSFSPEFHFNLQSKHKILDLYF